MHSKQYHSKATEGHELDNLIIDERIQTLQKESKYYSNYDDTAIKKKLVDHYDQMPSTHDSNFDNTSATLLNQLQGAIQSYRPVFKDSLSKKKLNFESTNFEMEKPQIAPIHEEEHDEPIVEIQKSIKFQSFQRVEPVRKPRISRIDKEISALYKENRNINLEYRKQKFMQLFLRPDDYSKY